MVQLGKSAFGRQPGARPKSSDWPRWLVGGIGVVMLLAGCDVKEVKACRDSYLESHAQVAQVDTTDLQSVEAALGAVDSNLALCRQANLREETEQLETAKRKLESHQYYLRQRSSQRELSPEELEKLVNNGDPTCPRGQMYVYRSSEKRVRCTGPQIIEMNPAQAREYFTSRNFKIHDREQGFKAEYGAESYEFSYESRSENRAARCLKVFAPPGIAWQETASRVTGLRPNRLKVNEPVVVGAQQWPLAVGGDDTQAVLEFGQCP